MLTLAVGNATSTCGDVKGAYQAAGCCGNAPTLPVDVTDVCGAACAYDITAEGYVRCSGTCEALGDKLNVTSYANWLMRDVQLGLAEGHGAEVYGAFLQLEAPRLYSLSRG